jgi:hypothetical protein
VHGRDPEMGNIGKNSKKGAFPYKIHKNCAPQREYTVKIFSCISGKCVISSTMIEYKLVFYRVYIWNAAIMKGKK